MSDQDKFDWAVIDFVGAFEKALHRDWPSTRKIIDAAPGDRTFLEQGLADPTGSCGDLMQKHQALISLMKQRGRPKSESDV